MAVKGHLAYQQCMRKLITDVYHVGIVREQDSDFGEISSVPSDDAE